MLSSTTNAMGPERARTVHLRLILLLVLVITFAISLVLFITWWQGPVFLVQVILCIIDAIFVMTDIFILRKLLFADPDHQRFTQSVWPSVRKIMDVVFAFLFALMLILEWSVPEYFNIGAAYANLFGIVAFLLHFYNAIPLLKQLLNTFLEDYSTDPATDPNRLTGAGAGAGRPIYCTRCHAEVDFEHRRRQAAESQDGEPYHGNSDVPSSSRFAKKDRLVDLEAGEGFLAPNGMADRTASVTGAGKGDARGPTDAGHGDTVP